MTTYKTNDLFDVPDKFNKPATTIKQLKSVKVSTPRVADSTARLPGQGFLPGLSRRGRPRLGKPISAVERTAEHRRKRIAKGAKRVEIILDKDVSQALDRLADHHQEPRSDVIATLIRKAAARLKV